MTPRYAILADVHANLEALSAVLAAARAEGLARIVCCGDLVGYHADPEACIDLLRSHDAVCVTGNHDRVAAGLCEPVRFGAAARRAALWTRARLGAEHRAFLARLPLTITIDDGAGRGFLVFHGALHPVPNADLHLSNSARVHRTMEALRDEHAVRLAFHGHTHLPAVHELAHESLRLLEGPSMQLSADRHHLVNPGSVGQSRDEDWRASFAIYEPETATVRFRRVEYDRAACLAKARNAGLLDEPRPFHRLARAAFSALRRLA